MVYNLRHPIFPRDHPMQVECWLWRYRDAASGLLCETERPLTEAEVAGYAEAERIPGSMTLRQVDEEEDTTPDVFRTGRAPLDD